MFRSMKIFHLAFLFHSSCPVIFSLFSLEEFGVSLHVLVNGSWNVGSGGIDVHSSFWGHHRILWFRSFVNEMIEEIALYEETHEEQNGTEKHLNYYGNKEKRYVYAYSEQKEKPELGFFIQRFPRVIVAQPDYYVLCLLNKVMCSERICFLCSSINLVYLNSIPMTTTRTLHSQMSGHPSSSSTNFFVP